MSALLKTNEVCDQLRVKRKFLYGLIAARILPAIKLNSRTYRFRVADIEAYLARHQTKTAL